MPNYIREEQIESEVTRIEQSTLSAKKYIQRYGASFSLAQFYRYRDNLAREGITGLRDRRKDGNHQKLKSVEIAFLRGLIKSKPNATPSEARQAIADEFGIQVHCSTISRILKRFGVTKAQNERQVVKSIQVSHAGFELITAMAMHLGWPEYTAQCVREVVEKKRFDSQQSKPIDKKGRNAKGQFTGSYNKRPSIRKKRGAKIELKRSEKELQRMDIFKISSKNVERKALAILALPLVTLNGEVRHVNTALGNALKGFCGYNYKQATLDQFLRELKYLGVSESLLGSQIRFWYDKWERSGSKLELPFLCYYIDGNTKPVWSKYRVMQNKVTMLGRVMGCLEPVFVHDCFGHPIYFETYSGHAPMGVYTRERLEKVEQHLEGVDQTRFVTRVLVMDGANNSVETLRALASQTRYHYITTLDDNQWSERKIRLRICSRTLSLGKSNVVQW
jgi:transposase